MKSIVVRSIAAVLLTGAFALVSFAQTQEDALPLLVNYNTLRNGRPLDASVKEDVDRLGKKAAAESAKGKYGDAMDDYRHAIALMRGETWTPTLALSLSLKIGLSRAVLEPGTPFTINISSVYETQSLPDGKVSVKAALLNMSGTEVADLGRLPQISPKLKNNPASINATAPAVPDGKYRVQLTLTPSQGDPITKSVEVRVYTGLEKRIASLRKRSEALHASLASAHKENLTDALETVDYRIKLYDIANAQKVDIGRVDLGAELAIADQELAALESGKDPFASARGDLHRAYLSRVDNTLQPYRLYIPTAYDGSKAFPLIIALHGMGGDENSIFDFYDSGLFKKLAEERGYIVACPKGREPASMYRGPAEQDVLDVIAEVEKDYKVNPDRVYMTGHSMGGFGTWSIAIDHPAIFAALAPISGGGDPTKFAVISRIPQIVIHGDSDSTVPVERSKVMVEAAHRAGTEIRFVEIPGGSHISVAAPSFHLIFDWFDAHTKSGHTVLTQN